MRTYRKISVVVVLAAVAALAAPASATVVDSNAVGSDMAGGTLTVTFQFAGAVVAPIVAGPGVGEGSAMAGGMFSFSVIGDTYANTWHLINLTTTDFIILADFNLPSSQSLFDSNTTPSTPNSLVGEVGVLYVSGPAESSSWEYQPWSNTSNLGDMYEGEIIHWEADVFLPATTYVWRDDTDVVPEPVTLVVLLGGGAGLLLRRRRRKQ